MSKYDEFMKLLEEQVDNKDGLISLSTITLEPGPMAKAAPSPALWTPIMRTERSFYTVTYATSNKMQQIAKKPEVAVCIIVSLALQVSEYRKWTSMQMYGSRCSRIYQTKKAATLKRSQKPFSRSRTQRNPHYDLRSARKSCLWHAAYMLTV